MMTRRRRFWIDFLKPVNLALSFLLGLFTMLWGVWVGNPFWDVFGRAPLYNFMSFFPEWSWGVVAILAGLTIVYGAWHPSYLAITRGSWVGTIYWLLVSIMFFLGDWQNTGGITAATLAILSAFIWVNLRVNEENFALITKE